jgi:tRNA (guanine37-N1)-methyltransferase
MREEEYKQPCRASHGAEVNRGDAERVRKLLACSRVLDTSLKPIRAGDKIIFPVTDAERARSILADLDDARLDVYLFPVAEKRPKSLKEALAGMLSEEKLSLLPSSYDVVGDIAIIQIRPGIEDISREIAMGIMKINPSIKVVLGEVGGISGTYRLPRLIHLYGEERTWTIHRENSCVFELDVSRVYFSPRLSNERKRIFEQVGGHELVIDMFAGVGPFSIEIARHRKARVKAVELNPDAYEYLRRNIRLNRVEGLVEPILGDAAEVVPRINEAADRIIMNYPADSLSYLKYAVKAVKRGGTIHIYGFSDSLESWLREVELRLKQLGISEYEVSGKLVREVAPRRYNVVADILLR